MKTFTAILIMVWIIYQAIYSKYAPDESIIWECYFYIGLYLSVGFAMWCIKAKNAIVRLIFIYAGSYFVVLTFRYVYLLLFMDTYLEYYHSVIGGWVAFKVFFPLFGTGLIYSYQEWQMNR